MLRALALGCMDTTGGKLFEAREGLGRAYRSAWEHGTHTNFDATCAAGLASPCSTYTRSRESAPPFR